MQDLDFLMGNALFKGLLPNQIEKISHLFETKEFKRGDFIIKENEISDIIYIIKKGEAEVVKLDPYTGDTHALLSLHAGDVIGEVSLLDEAPRSASIVAKSPCRLLGISMHQLQSFSMKEEGLLSQKIMRFLTQKSPSKSIFSTILKNLTRLAGNRIRKSNLSVIEGLQKELTLTKMHMAMGHLIINIVVLLCLYLWLVQSTIHFRESLHSTIYFTAPFIAVVAIFVMIFMKQSGYPISLYGFTLKNWKKSIIEASWVTLAIALIVLGIKWFLIEWDPAYANKPFIFILGAIKNPNFSLSTYLSILIAYSLFAPLQEIIVRGALQSSFNEFLIGKRKGVWSVFLSNIIFSVTHTHLSILASLMVFFPGLLWGWLYLRTPTLVGVIFSHILIGIWALFIIGLF